VSRAALVTLMMMPRKPKESHVVCVHKRKAWGRSQGFKGTMCVKVHLVKEGGPSDKVHRVGDKTNIGGGLCVGDIVYQIVRAV